MANAGPYQRSSTPSTFPPLCTTPSTLSKQAQRGRGDGDMKGSTRRLGLAKSQYAGLLGQLQARHNLDVTGRPAVSLGAIKPVWQEPIPKAPTSACPSPGGGLCRPGCREGWPLPSRGRIYLYERRLGPNKAKGCVIIFQKAILFLRLHLLCISLLE